LKHNLSPLKLYSFSVYWCILCRSITLSIQRPILIFITVEHSVLETASPRNAQVKCTIHEKNTNSKDSSCCFVRKCTVITLIVSDILSVFRVYCFSLLQQDNSKQGHFNKSVIPHAFRCSQVFCFRGGKREQLAFEIFQ